MNREQRHPNEFERAILDRIVRDTMWLRDTSRSLRVTQREYTGVGSYTDFECDVPKSEEVRHVNLNVLIRVSNVPSGMGAVLWCCGTSPECLEIFTFGEDSWDGTYDGFDFEASNDA
ncbi:MAG: hypothetical protein R3C18_15860 [Planctomycetaceae bacterium]